MAARESHPGPSPQSALAVTTPYCSLWLLEFLGLQQCLIKVKTLPLLGLGREPKQTPSSVQRQGDSSGPQRTEGQERALEGRYDRLHAVQNKALSS